MLLVSGIAHFARRVSALWLYLYFYLFTSVVSEEGTIICDLLFECFM